MKPLVEKYKPASLAEFAGLAEIKALFSRFTADPYSSAWLLIGPAGTGKTTMAYAIAEQIGGQVQHIPARMCNLETVGQVVDNCKGYPMFSRTPWHIVICDEADRMTPAAQLAFLSILDGTETPENTVFLFTANESKGLEKRFLSRTRVIEFDLQPETDAAIEFLANVWKSESRASVPDLRALFAACDYNLRDALMKLEVKLAMLPKWTAAPKQQTGRFVQVAGGRSVWVTA